MLAYRRDGEEEGSMFSKEEMQQEREKAMRLHGITNPDATDEEIRDCVYKNLIIPSYEEFKKRLFDEIKEIGIEDDKEYIEEVFNPKSDLYEYSHFPNDLFFHINQSDFSLRIYSIGDHLFDFVFGLIAEYNMLWAYGYEAHDISDNMPLELDDKRPETVSLKYWDRLYKDDIRELKDLIMSLAQDDEE